MGSWGTNILENDQSLDTWEHYMDLFETGQPPDKIKEAMFQHESKSSMPALYDNTSFWFGLAQAQIDTGYVDKTILEIIGKINNERIDLDEYWARNPKINKEREEQQILLYKKLLDCCQFQSKINKKLTKTSIHITNSESRLDLIDYGKTIEYLEEKIKETEAQVSDAPSQRHKRFFLYLLWHLSFEILLFDFIAGKKREILVQNLNVITSHLEAYLKELEAFDAQVWGLGQYIQIIWLTSILFLLDGKTEIMAPVCKINEKFQKDCLINLLLSFRKDKVHLTGCVQNYPNEFINLYNIINKNEEAEIRKKIQHHLTDCSSSIDLGYFFYSHPELKNQYWSFESAAIIKKYKFSEKDFVDFPCYPKGLI